MSNIWFTSDTHFNHANILKFTGADGTRIRPLFSSLEEMNEAMIERWNDVVRDDDKVYHLGDVYMGHEKNADEILSRLKGKKRLILGNHDDGKSKVLQKHFKKVLMWRKFGEFGFLATHVPVHEQTMYGNVVLNLHGHIHEKPDYDSRYMNISVERTAYAPVHLDEVMVRVKELT